MTWGAVGQRRAALAGTAHQVRAARTPLVPAVPDDKQLHDGDPAVLRYRGPVPMVLLGPITRRVYRFATADEVVVVDPSDVGPFLRTGWFVARVHR